LNPYIQAPAIRRIYWYCCLELSSNDELLLVLGPFFKRIEKRTLNLTPYKRQLLYALPTPYVVGNIVNVLLDFNPSNRHLVFSVRRWYARGSDTISSQIIAPEVTEWWILQKSPIPLRNGFDGYFVGYHEDKAWVFDAEEMKLYTNFVLLKNGQQFCHRMRFPVFEEYYESWTVFTRTDELQFQLRNPR
jgi:hypothetical protein